MRADDIWRQWSFTYKQQMHPSTEFLKNFAGQSKNQGVEYSFAKIKDSIEVFSHGT